MAKKNTKNEEQKEDQERTKKAKESMLVALESTLGVVTPACKSVGISRRTFYTWKLEDNDFKKAVEDIENIALDFAESHLHKNIKKGKESSTIFYLKTKGRGRGYIEKKEMDVTTGGEKINQTVDLTKLDTETLRALKEAAKNDEDNN